MSLNLFTFVMYDIVRSVLGGNANAVIFSNKHDMESALGKHSWELSFTLANGQSLFRVIPTEGDRRVHSLFIVVSVVFVFVEREITVCSAINAQLNRVFGLLGGPLYLRPHWNNRTGTHK